MNRTLENYLPLLIFVLFMVTIGIMLSNVPPPNSSEYQRGYSDGLKSSTAIWQGLPCGDICLINKEPVEQGRLCCAEDWIIRPKTSTDTPSPFDMSVKEIQDMTKCDGDVCIGKNNNN